MPTSAPTWSSLRTRTAALARQMDWFRGLRAAVALCAPLVLGDLAGIPNLGWAALGGFEAILADTGGPYRSRMASLATLSLGGAAGLFLGSITGASLHWALPRHHPLLLPVELSRRSWPALFLRRYPRPGHLHLRHRRTHLQLA